jgi:hypothetical protein
LTGANPPDIPSWFELPKEAYATSTRFEDKE